ncbi:FAD-dependent oxidoreductase [Actinomadura flavalba]|uniref:FAD-dependent oxidoreductase n=1 Tax=Actinomadura flavalba TaxID=1120938 RepID=UPI0003A0E8DE|nr:FAD-dependent oxidoreductase [Actinomadura flavalba]
MPHVVTQSCCNDASCVHACPVNCIHPTPDEPDFHTAEMLYIDPASCVDCGACVSACPVGAIVPHTKLADDQLTFLPLNADFFAPQRPKPPLLAKVTEPLRVRPADEPLRVAVVGSGPAAMFAADELLTIPDARVNVFERLSVPYGLARTGVAPDHGKTRQVTDLFDTVARQDGFRLFLGVEVGRDITHEELLAHHHAVVYAVGASSDRRLTVPGAETAATATEFVAWYNGHPDHAHRTFDLSHRRAVVVGNGNVALDVARILTRDPESLADTDISPLALDALRASAIEEVVVVGRRGPAQSAFTVAELTGLLSTPGIDVVAEGLGADPVTDGLPHSTVHKLRMLRDLPEQDGTRRRIVLRYLLTPERVTDTGVAFVQNELVDEAGVARAVPTDRTEHIEAGLVLSSIGYKGRPVADLPFDDATGTVPHDSGRVIDPGLGTAVPATYVTGWIKRGPTGFIGTNKTCARETVHTLVDDYNIGRLPTPSTDPEVLERLIRSRTTTPVPTP